MKSNKVVQSNNRVVGDVVGGNKNVYIQKLIAKARNPLRMELGFDLEIDSENTVLIRKLTDGEINRSSRNIMISKKIKTLPIILDFCRHESGLQVIADLYENLLSVLNLRYLSNMDEGDLLKVHMKDIFEDFTGLVQKYEDLISIDEAFVEGLLYIATSNCAIDWKVDNVS